MSSSDDNNGEVECVLVENILPAKSKEKYLTVYENFMKWKVQNNEKSFSEKVFLSYFNEICKTRKPSSLWGIYSMLKSTMRAKHNIYLKSYANLLLWLKERSVGFKSKKSKILTEEHIKKFLDEAPDEKYLATKVALILGVSGQLRANELPTFTTKNIKFVEDMMIGVLFDSQNKTEKIFAIRDEYIPIVMKYQALRPQNLDTPRFFLNFREGHCTKQVIGRHKMATMPKEIASYLKLPTPERYTGHCFRRSAAVFGAVVSTVPRSSAHGEITDIIEFAKRYRRGYSARKSDVNFEVLPLPSEAHEEAMELTHEVNIKTEEVEEAIDEVIIKAEPVDETTVDPISAFERGMQSTSKPSVSGRHSQLSDNIMEDSDEDDDLEDMVRISSEDVDYETTLQSLRKESSQDTSSEHDTKITVAGKNITILFKNCTNVGNVTVNIINK